MPLFEKYFTVEAANALLPRLREIVLEMQSEIERLGENDSELPKSLNLIPTNGGGRKIDAFFEASNLIRDRLAEVSALGVQIKDIRRGLLDFPALRDNGEEVLLCWLVEEPSVEFWHDLEQGFLGRQGLETL
jgi:hypothetical protein